MKDALLLAKVDREDYWVSGGLAFVVNHRDTYQGAYEEIKHKLETPEIVKYIVDEHCLLDDEFDGDETYTFVETKWNNAVEFVFKNSEEDEVTFCLGTNFIKIPE